ncbi:helix-turn-helix domain-containing protein, partial [Burkholderia cepacia]|uniref:helix-turn-helix domain-containing protein n=1 Tax=Burkholderia cepacia TaxID=292 RepID=UPI000A6D0AC1
SLTCNPPYKQETNKIPAVREIEAWSLTSAAGRMTMQVLNAVAEFERDLLIERTQAGIARAKAEGKAMGRPSALSKQQQDEVRQQLSQGASVASLAKSYGTSRQTIMRVREAV